mmetsp:Transcript_20624/g.18206  ORF Transcript_20624/g.18206 Transcript_20624/m.18206 type:complete len:270 (+) Transcript_20624:107-916(+)
MVRTRSGRASTKQENDETPVKQVSPKKVTIKSPRVNTQKVGWAYGILIDLCFAKPTDKTFSFWSCLQGLIILGIAGYSVFDELHLVYPDFYFYQFILAVHAFDLLTNFCNELVGNGHLNDMILFTETMCNISEIYLFLFMINQASNLWITVVVLASFYILALNLKYKTDDKIWVRVVTYLVLFMCFGLNNEFIMNDIRITAYASFVFASMVFDAFDFPDKFVNLIPMCEGLVIFSRAAAVYMLITSQLIANKDAEFTNFELTIKGFIGM